MQVLAWKLRIVVLWIFLAVSMTTAVVLYLVEPGVLEEVLAGEIEGMDTGGPILVVFALFTLVPLALAFLTLALPERPNRWANGVMGIFFALANAFDLVGHDVELTGEALVVVVSVLVGLLVAWHAWRWPVSPLAAAPGPKKHVYM